MKTSQSVPNLTPMTDRLLLCPLEFNDVEMLWPDISDGEISKLLHKVCVARFAGNEASKNLVCRLGFRYVGSQSQEFKKDGIWHNHELYELHETEFF